MSTKLLTYRGTHRLLTLLLLLTTLLCAAPAAQATPSEEVTTGWVDLQAHVPEGFKGSVSVLLENKNTGETQIITSYYLNDYVNSVQIPLGEYIVVSAFTSEDSFIYEAFTKTRQFTLKDEIKIEVTVEYNPEGEGILANLNKEPDEVIETAEEPDAKSTDTTTTKTEESTETSDSDTEPKQDKEITKPEEDETPDGDGGEEKNSDTIVKTIRNILLTIAATLAFLLGTTLLVVYVRFRFGND